MHGKCKDKVSVNHFYFICLHVCIYVCSVYAAADMWRLEQELVSFHCVDQAKQQAHCQPLVAFFSFIFMHVMLVCVFCIMCDGPA